MAREKLSTQIRRDQILDVVLKLIATRGTCSLRMTRVARQVGLVPSALYRHFKNRDEIIDAAIDRFQAMVLANFRLAAQESRSAQERLHLLLRRQMEIIRENQINALPRIVFSEDLYGNRPQRKAKVYRMLKNNLSRLENCFRDGQLRGEFRKELDPRAAARMFLAILQSSAILWFVSNGTIDVMGNAEAAWVLMKNAMAARASKASL
ncbi:MAG: TetR/AcrR family transcriptional regulator [Acidobacteriia bacterium]|nr:TetR/AcrR family transcriptional regulator [Terriglobia bacterium]